MMAVRNLPVAERPNMAPFMPLTQHAYHGGPPPRPLTMSGPDLPKLTLIFTAQLIGHVRRRVVYLLARQRSDGLAISRENIT